MRVSRFAVLLALASVCSSRPSVAQSLGTLTWQLQPYCNRVALSITQNGAVYTLDGYDDQCGAPQRAPVVGTGTPNPDGFVSLGLTIVTTPGGRSVHVDAQVSPATGNGSWRDSEGNSGSFALGAATGGSPRREPTGAPMAGSYIDVSSAALGGPHGFGVIVTGATPSNGAAIMAQWGDAPALVPSYPGAILGTSRGEAGLVGLSDTAAGVVGLSYSGTGVGGSSSTGPGVFGISLSGPGVRAMAGTSTAVALEVDGALSVGGAVRPVFRHVSSLANNFGNLTKIDHPLTNLDPTAMLVVTHEFAAGATGYIGAIGIYYDNTSGKWTIFREDQLAMPAGMIFNVLVVKQ